MNRRYRALDLDYSRRFAVEQPAGAFLMVRRAVWQELGGFDERFSRSGSKMWIFAAARRIGDIVLYYVPEAVAKHTGGHSISQLNSRDAPLLLVS